MGLIERMVRQARRKATWRRRLLARATHQVICHDDCAEAGASRTPYASAQVMNNTTRLRGRAADPDPKLLTVSPSVGRMTRQGIAQ